jgi:hypothetical protein
LGSSALPIEPRREPKTKRPRKRVGRGRKLDKRVEPKPDGRYLIYYKPSGRSTRTDS